MRPIPNSYYNSFIHTCGAYVGVYTFRFEFVEYESVTQKHNHIWRLCIIIPSSKKPCLCVKIMARWISNMIIMGLKAIRIENRRCVCMSIWVCEFSCIAYVRSHTARLVWFYWACCYLIVGCANTTVSSPRWILKRWTEKYVRLNDILEWERQRAKKKQMSAQCAKYIPNIFAIKFAGVFYELRIIVALNKDVKTSLCVINYIFSCTSHQFVIFSPHLLTLQSRKIHYDCVVNFASKIFG